MEVLRDLHTLVSIKEGKGQEEWLDLGKEKKTIKFRASYPGIAQSANSLSTFTAYHLSLLSSVLSIHTLSIHVFIYLPHACIYMYLLNILSIDSLRAYQLCDSQDQAFGNKVSEFM